MKRVGILGDGQLALMLAESLQDQRIPFQIYSGRFDDRLALQNFAREVDVVTTENEFISSEVYRQLDVAKIPDADSYANLNNKSAQRSFFAALDLPQHWYWKGNWKSIPETLPYPVIVKRAHGGYDGYGNLALQNPNERAERLEKTFTQWKLADQDEVVVEEFLNLRSELAGAFASDGKHFVLFPIVQTIQANHVCRIVLFPPREDSSVLANVQLALEKLARSGMVGFFAFEFFVNQEGKVFLNEAAPRNHNSQHLSREAFSQSQFDVTASLVGKGILSMEPIQTKHAVMINFLGERQGNARKPKYPQISAGIQVYYKDYGKKEERPGRKMGHLTLVDPSGMHDLLKLGQKILTEGGWQS